MNEIINKISQIHFKTLPGEIVEIEEGKNNSIYKVLVNNKNYIFRINSENYIEEYTKEKHCIAKAKEVGILTPDCLYVGTENNYAYMVLEYIESISDDEEISYEWVYRVLGEYTRKMNNVDVKGFGKNVKDSENGFYLSWEEYIDSVIDYVFKNDLLLSKKIINKEQEVFIKEKISEMKKWDVSHKLGHGDLHGGNVIITPQKEIYLIDWGNGAGNVNPYFDLGQIIAWKSTSKHLTDFLEGYGMSKEEYLEIEPKVNHFLIIRLMETIKKMIDKGDGKEHDKFIEKSIERIMGLK